MQRSKACGVGRLGIAIRHGSTVKIIEDAGLHNQLWSAGKATWKESGTWLLLKGCDLGQYET